MPEKSQAQVIEERKTRTAKYAVEDFYSAIAHLNRVAAGHGFLLIFLGLSLIFSAENGLHIAFCAATIAACVAMQQKMSFKERNSILTGAGIYAGLLLLELMTGGIPDPMSPALAVHRNWEGGELTRLLNGMSPFIYVGLRIIFIYPFALIYNKLAAAEKQPAQYLAKTGFKSADKP